MGLIDLNSQISESRISSAMATDAEVTAAIQAHLAAAHPQPVLPTSIVQVQVAPPAQISYPGGGQFFDLGVLNNANPGSTESLFAVAVYVQFVSGGQTFPHWQASGSIILSPIQWKNTGRFENQFTFPMESHDTDDFQGGIKLAAGQMTNRRVMVFFSRAFTASLIRATFVRLR